MKGAKRAWELVSSLLLRNINRTHNPFTILIDFGAWSKYHSISSVVCLGAKRKLSSRDLTYFTYSDCKEWKHVIAGWNVPIGSN